MSKFKAYEAAQRYEKTDFRHRDADTPYPELWGFMSGYSQAIMDVFDAAEAIRDEADIMMMEHPSKDARFFAQSVLKFFISMLETQEAAE